MKRVKAWILGALLAGGLAPIALAAPMTIDFDTGSDIASSGDSFDVDGFTFASETVPGGTGAFIEYGFSRDLGGIFNANGSRIVMSAADGSTFDLLGFDFSRRDGDTTYVRSAASIDVIGNLAGGGTVMFNTGSLDLAYQAAAVPGSFIGLASVVFDPLQNTNSPAAFNYEFLLDNIEVSATVPLPASLSFLALGLAGLGGAGAMRKRRNAV